MAKYDPLLTKTINPTQVVDTPTHVKTPEPVSDKKAQKSEDSSKTSKRSSSLDHREQYWFF
jgi:hypothetical protein